MEQDKTNTEGTPAVEATNEFSKVAEAIAAQNTFTEPQFPTFSTDPFFKEEVKEEVKADEIKDEAKTEAKPEAEKTPENTETKPETTPEVKAETPQIGERDLIGFLNSNLESQFQSIDEIKSLIEENNKYKQREAEFLQLDQTDRARLQIGRDYGDYTLYDRVMNIDTSKLDHKEALRQSYILENEGDPEFLEMAFNKLYTKAYEDETDEEFSKRQLKHDGEKAIKKILETQEEFKKLGQVSGIVDPEEVKRAKEEEDNKWFTAVDEVLTKTDRIAYDLGEGRVLNIVMDAKDKQFFQNSMDQPLAWLKDRISDEKGNIDHAALHELQFGDAYREKIIQEAIKLGMALKHEEILKEKKNTSIETTKAGDAGSETSLRDQFASNFSKAINH